MIGHSGARGAWYEPDRLRFAFRVKFHKGTLVVIEKDEKRPTIRIHQVVRPITAPRMVGRDVRS